MDVKRRIKHLLLRLYPSLEVEGCLRELQELVNRFEKRQKPLSPSRSDAPSLYEACLICYANTLVDPSSKKKPLSILGDFLKRYRIDSRLNLLHILPFFPWDTDRGFSVTDYYRVHPEYGSWKHIRSLAEHVVLMVDFVMNHASIENPLVQGALIERHLFPEDPRYQRVAPYKDFVIAYSDADRPSESALKALVRPRPTPVLTPYTVLEKEGGALVAGLGAPRSFDPGGRAKVLGTGWVWTTFSRPKNPDQAETTRQVDLNFNNPAVLLEAAKILLHYMGKGASLIRLDAVGYVWKKVGAASIHEPQVHDIIRILRRLSKGLAPETRLVAEVNEPQDRILPYLGKKGSPECALVYQFTHFPLAVYAVLTGDGRPYMKWLKSLDPFRGRQFITILGSHDGMGLKPAHGWLSPDQMEQLLDILIREHGALPNYAALPGGKRIVYEICATPWNLVNKPKSKEPLPLCISRYLAVIHLGFLVRGLPAFYINGLIGAENAPLEDLDENRSINRQTFEAKRLFQMLDGDSRRMKTVFHEILCLLEKRRQHPAFDPRGPAAEPVSVGNPAVVLARLKSPLGKSFLWVCVNVSKKPQSVRIAAKQMRGRPAFQWEDALSGQCLEPDKRGHLALELNPYQVFWLKPL